MRCVLRFLIFLAKIL
uniref:Uncharacterized protein n=1 Tax=Lepeophtheirus salmonis TaxID=72036 RepID=A0A0K2UEA7_LEPSM